jgi:hypothetical protein
MRYQTKSKQLEEATSEGQYLREELDGRLQELDRLKLNEMKFDTSFKLKELDNVSVFLSLVHKFKLMISYPIHDFFRRVKSTSFESEISLWRDLSRILRKPCRRRTKKSQKKETSSFPCVKSSRN